MVDWTSGTILNLAGSVADLALAAYVLVLRPIRAPQWTLAGFATFLAIANVIPLVDPSLGGVSMVAYQVAVVGFSGLLVAFGLVFPRPVARAERRDIVLAALLATLVVLAYVAAAATTRELALVPLNGAVAFVLVLWSRRHVRTAPGDADASWQLVLLAVGGGAQFYTMGLRSATWSTPHAAALLAFVAIGSGAWLVATARTSGPAARSARTAALVFPLFALLGVLAGLAAGGTAAYGLRFGVTSLPNLWLVGVYVFAIVRLHLLGVDAKVRFAISKSALAAVFLGTFFIVAQIAQNWFGSSYGPVFGGITAGLLLFAISPIQRIAERVANAAVPVAAVASPAGATAAPIATLASVPHGRGDASYRKAVRIALRDRKLTREEETHLHELARDLGIDGPRASAILGEVEDELGRAR